MNELKLGRIDTLVLLGGGKTVKRFCLWGKSKNLNVKVITSPRHAETEIESNTFKNFLDSNNVSNLVTEKINTSEVKDYIGNPESSFFLSLGAAWIFKSNMIKELFANKLFNLHGTRLPQNRGGGGFSWQILTRNRFGFCVLHLIDGGIDTGNIVGIDEFLYPIDARLPKDYETFYEDRNFSFFTNWFEKNILGEVELNIKTTPQLEYFSTYWPRLNTNINGWIDWDMDHWDLEAFICAFDDPYQGASTTWNGERVFIKKASLNFQDGSFHSYQAGIVYRKGLSWICVALKNASLIIEEVRDEKGNSVLEKINIGDRFFTSIEKIESGKSERIIYTPNGLK